MSQDYKEIKHSIALRSGMPDSEVDLIDNVQFEFLREMMKLKKSVRLPSFGIFMLKGRYK